MDASLGNSEVKDVQHGAAGSPREDMSVMQRRLCVAGLKPFITMRGFFCYISGLDEIHRQISC